MSKNNRVAFGVAIVVVAAVVFGIVRMRAPSQPMKAFRIGFNEWVGFAPFFLAKERGYFGDLDVSLEFIDLEGDKRAGLYSGRLQMICETMDMFQTSRDNADYPGVIVFAIDESSGGDGVVASAEVQSLKDLKDQVVVSEPGQPAHFVLQYLLHQEGMTLSDVEVRSMASSDAASAFIAGKANVAGTYEPYLSTAMEKREGAHVLVSTKDLPGICIDVAVVTNKTLTEHREDVAAIYQGWVKATDELTANPTAAVAVMARAFKLGPDEFNDMRSGLRYFGRAENEHLFGTEQAPGPIRDTFDLVGRILRENDITSAVAPAAGKIKVNIVAKGP